MSKNTKKWPIVPGADYAMSYCVDTAAYQNEAVQFWEKYDKLSILTVNEV